MRGIRAIKAKIENMFPNLFRRVWVKSGPPKPPNLSEEKRAAFEQWRLRVKFDLPRAYDDLCGQGNYLAAFLLVSNLLEFHLMQKLFEFSHALENEHIPRMVEKFRFLPKPLLRIAIKVICKFSKTKTPAYYVEKRYTLGKLIREADKLGMDTKLVGLLGNFNGQRRLLVHKLCYLEHANRDIIKECKNACELANKIWEQL